jgi:hypothetical protein
LAAPVEATVSPYEQQFKEWFSRAFVQATSASAGVSAEWIRDDVWGVDVVLRDGGVSVDVQLKSTAAPDYAADGTLRFPLDVMTYNKLRDPSRLAPAYLLVAVLGPQRERWVGHEPTRTSLLHEARWTRLTDQPESPNSSSITIAFPPDQVLTAIAIREILDAARQEL